MKFNLISKKEYQYLLDVYNGNENLILENKGYEELNPNNLTDADKKNIKEIEKILNKSIEGFSRFQNFKHDKDKNIVLRFQYNYNHDSRNPTFIGVGYIKLTELLNGLEPENNPKIMTQYILTKDIDDKSKYQSKSPNRYVWYWKETSDRNIFGHLLAVTEMEAIDRLREAFPDVKGIAWLTKANYFDLFYRNMYDRIIFVLADTAYKIKDIKYTGFFDKVIVLFTVDKERYVDGEVLAKLISTADDRIVLDKEYKAEIIGYEGDQKIINIELTIKQS